MKIEEFKKIDNSFDENLFLSEANNIFIKLLSAIMFDELDTVDHFISDKVYKWADDIIKKNNNNGVRQVYEELNIENSSISGIRVKENVYEINVFLQSRYLNYIISLNEGSYVSGNKSSREKHYYNMVFEKKVDALKQEHSKRCPYCGHPMNVNDSGKCLYCGGIYNQEDYDWVLTELEVC